VDQSQKRQIAGDSRRRILIDSQLVNLHGAEIVGTIALLDIGHNQGALRKMFVKAQFRGSTHGVARRLLQVLLEWCQLRNFHEIYLGTTARFLAAHRFYEKNGFWEIEQTELPGSFPVMSVDTKFYKYLFANEKERLIS
jgi:N-acetylglutamate synthase-like GNAT family acetyltransferase